MANKTKPTRPLRILYWNSDGVEQDKLLLGIVMERENIDLALLGETKLNQTVTLESGITSHTVAQAQIHSMEELQSSSKDPTNKPEVDSRKDSHPI